MSALYKSKLFWLVGAAVSILFIALILSRTDFIAKLCIPEEKGLLTPTQRMPDRDSYMNIFQSDTKIGYSHSTFNREAEGYHLEESVFMRINTLGTIQDIHVDTDGWLNPDYSLASFVFSLRSGLFDFSVQGLVTGNYLSVETNSAGEKRKFELPVPQKPFLMNGVVDAVAAANVKVGDEFRFDVFDPATMGQAPVIVRILGKDKVHVMGQARRALRASLEFKGSTQEAWIGENGEILKEAGLLGITLVKTTKTDALSGIRSDHSRDITEQASIGTRIKLEHPDRLQSLKIKLAGIPLKSLQIDGGRQRLAGEHLVVKKEKLNETDTPPITSEKAPEDLAQFLKPTPFIQSDHPKIRAMSTHIVGSSGTMIEKGRKLVNWVFTNIHKRPVLSLPDALSTLENRMGDCNEHAVLLAALARSANIPAKIETGLVYLKGRFYYHAWNALYLNEWITADAVFGQIPADVTHIRFTSGDQKEQLDLMQVIGKIELQIVEAIE